MIYEIKKLVNEENLVILYSVPFQMAEGKPRIQGVIQMQTPVGLVPIEFDFPPEIQTPEAAFAAFKDTANAWVKQMEDERPRVATLD